MKPLKDFETLIRQLAGMQQRRTVALACPHDSHTEYVIRRALDEGIARFILTTSGPISDTLAEIISRHTDTVSVIECDTPEEASHRAVIMAHDEKADVLMKGTVNTDVLLRAVLDKQSGLLLPDSIMTHITVAHLPALDRLIVFSDAAVIPRPTLAQFDAIVSACADTCRRIGIGTPRIALTHCTEKVSPKFEHTLSYTELIKRAANGSYGDVAIGGPMDVKTALDAESGAIKGIQSEVAGRADVLIFPNIEAGNTFYKTITLLAGAHTAGWLTGTTVPVVVASRADSEVSKYYSLVMAVTQSR